jgi:hypothetical protein
MLCFILPATPHSGTGNVFRIDARRVAAIRLDTPDDSTTCDAGRRSHDRPLLDEPGARVRLTLLLLTVTTHVAALGGTRPGSGALPLPDRTAWGMEQPPERSVVGTLDQVDATSTAIVVKTPAGKQTFTLQDGATIRQGSKTIKASELGAHKGERVKVRYRDIGGTHRAEWIVVASPAPSRKGRTA